MTRYGVFLKDSNRWWRGDNKFCIDPIAAKWFDSMTAAELAALRYLPDPVSAWTVKPIPVGQRGQGEQ